MGYFLTEKTSTYNYDPVGSTTAITADDGATVTDRFQYSPYGVLTHREGDTDTPFLYNGRYGVMTDSNGLLHMRARYYNPLIRRFINADPTGFDGGLNWYAYANNSPLLYVDPEGEVPLLAVIAVGIVLGGSIDAAATTFNDVVFGNGFNLENTSTAFLRGAIAGGVSSVATPLAGTVIRSTMPLLRNTATIGFSSVGSLTGQLAHNSINSNYGFSDGLLAATALGGLGQGVSNRLIAVPRWGHSLSQMRSFGPRRLKSALTSPNSWRNHSSVSVSSGVSAAGNFLPQNNRFISPSPRNTGSFNNNSFRRGNK